MNLNNTGFINKTGVATNCLMYMLIRLATQNKETETLEDSKKSFIIMDSINRSLSKVEGK